MSRYCLGVLELEASKAADSTALDHPGDRDSPEEIRRVFKLFDDDETGKISFRNLKRVARELGENMTDEELQEMINKADIDGDGEVNEEEFLRIMTYKHSFKAEGK